MTGKNLFLLAMLAIALCQAAVAASIDGTVYTSDLAVARYSLLSINTTPTQRVLLEDGTYNITVPRGSYAMQVTYYRENRKYEDRLNVTVVDNGQYTYDFIVFSTESNQTQVLVTPTDLSFDAPTQSTSTAVSIGWWPAVLLLVALVALSLFLSRRQWWQGIAPAAAQVRSSQREGNPKMENEKSVDELSDDLAGVLAVIKAEGGRTTQKELRKHIPVSEAKLSMMLTELEASGKVRKIKKGRGNLIVLK